MSGFGANLVVLVTAVFVLTLFAFEFGKTWKMTVLAQSNYSVFTSGAVT